MSHDVRFQVLTLSGRPYDEYRARVQQLDELAERNARMDQLREEVGRDPSTLRRSVNLFDAEARAAGGRLCYYDDEDLLVDLVSGLRQAGYSEFGLYYPSDSSQLDAFERIATDTVPSLRDGKVTR